MKAFKCDIETRERRKGKRGKEEREGRGMRMKERNKREGEGRKGKGREEQRRNKGRGKKGWRRRVGGKGTKERERNGEGKREILLLMYCLITFSALSLCTVFPPPLFVLMNEGGHVLKHWFIQEQLIF